jgi:hypothetical protein
MKTPIQDEFTDLKISRQRKYQLRMQRDGRCTECGEPALEGARCLKHLVKARERQRKKRGLQRRYYNTLSYRLAEQLKAQAKKKAGPSKRAPRAKTVARK